MMCKLKNAALHVQEKQNISGMCQPSSDRQMYMQRMEITGTSGISSFRVLRNFHTDFQSDCTTLYSHIPLRWDVSEQGRGNLPTLVLVLALQNVVKLYLSTLLRGIFALKA